MENLPTPLNRVELYLGAAAQMAGVTPPEAPLSRLEQYLAFIAGDTSVELPAPASLCEQWLAYVAGIAPIETLKIEGAFHIGPQKVDVRFFAAAAGMPGVIAPEPQNRTEQFWAKLAEILPVHGVQKYATGTNIALTDVAWWKMGLERINGDTTQQTYSGKNLFNVADKYGTWASNVSVDSDGWITVTGNTNTFTNLYTNASTNISTSTTYYAVVEVKSVTYDSGTAYLKATSAQATSQAGNASELYFNLISAGETYVLPFETVADFSGTDKMLRTFVYTATAGSSITFRLSVVAVEPNPADFNYEPYVGGVPAPNPDYPQAINTVTGEQTVTVRSPQLITKQGMATSGTDKEFWTLFQRMSSSDLGNGWARYTVETNGTNYGNFWLSTTAVDGFSTSSTYTMIFEIDNITNKTGYIDFLSTSNADDPFASFEMIYGTSSSETVARLNLASNQTLFVMKATTKSSVNKALRAFTRPNVPYGTKFDIRATFLAGDHSADWQNFCGNNWQPYQKTEYKLNLVGSNLYDKDKAYKSGNDAHLDIDVEPNTTYVFSTGRSWTGVFLYDSTGTQTRKVGNDYGIRYDVVFATRADEVKATLTFYLGAEDIHTYDFTGVDFHESIELRKIGTYQDYIYKNGKDWYVHNNTTIQSTGTGFVHWSNHSDACMFNLDGTLADALFQQGTTTAVVRNLVVQPAVKNMTTYYDTYAQTNRYGFALKTATPGILVQNKDTADINSFKEWLRQNPLVVRYVLATPTDAKITNQTLISQLNALDRAVLPQPIAYITASGDLPGELKISYYGEEE